MRDCTPGETHCTRIRCAAHLTLGLCRKSLTSQLNVPEIPWQSWMWKAKLNTGDTSKTWNINYKALGRSACNLGCLRHLWRWRKWKETQQGWSRETQANSRHISAAGLSHRLETYLVTLPVLYLLIWFALLYWTFHFKDLGIKDNTVTFDFQHFLAKPATKQRYLWMKCHIITPLSKEHFYSICFLSSPLIWLSLGKKKIFISEMLSQGNRN